MRKVALVTGGNGQVGRSIVIDLLKRDFKVFCLDISFLSDEVSSEDLSCHKIDITSENDVNNFFLKEFGETGLVLDVLINNAGIGTFDPFENRSKSAFMKVLEVNLFGTFNMIKNSMKYMVQSKNIANIVNIGSVYGVVSSDPNIYKSLNRMNSEVYSASKAGVIQMTRYFAVHLSNMKICVNCVSPGGVFNNHPDDFIKRYASKTPIGRMAAVEEISSSVMFFCENQNQYLTGQNLVVDGGLTSW
jgi:3-oxoacyl-[acyl-carrier protein] reductase